MILGSSPVAQYWLQHFWLISQLSNRPFHEFWAKRSGDWRFFCCSETWNDGFWCPKLRNGWLVGFFSWVLNYTPTLISDVFFVVLYWFGGILGSVSIAEVPVSLSNHIGFTPWLLYSSTHHSPVGIIQLRTGWAQDDWLQ